MVASYGEHIFVCTLNGNYETTILVYFELYTRQPSFPFSLTNRAKILVLQCAINPTPNREFSENTYSIILLQKSVRTVDGKLENTIEFAVLIFGSNFPVLVFKIFRRRSSGPPEVARAFGARNI